MTRRSDWAMVLGGAPCVWYDVLRLEAMVGGWWPGRIIVVNDVGVHWPRAIHAWVSLHPTKLVESDPDHPEGWSWVRQRAARGHPAADATWSHRRPGLVHETTDFWGGGSSGLFGITVAKALGCERIALCGIPMDTSGHFEESEAGHDFTEERDHYWQVWERHAEELQDGRTRSMGGETARFLGRVTPEWLEVQAGVCVDPQLGDGVS